MCELSDLADDLRTALLQRNHFRGNNDVYLLDIDTGAETSIVQNTTTTIQHPSVSPDGHSIAYDVYCPGDSTTSIWIVPIATNNFVCQDGARVTSMGIGPARFPSFSTTGLVAFEHDAGNTHVAVVSPGGPSTDVTTGGDDRNPNWSPASLVLP